MSFVRHLFLATLAAFVALPALAQQKLLPAQSEIVFVSKQMGVPVEGRFKKFDAQIAFTVDTGSASLGVPEADEELPKAVWFNVKGFPQATFQSSGFKALGGGRYEVAGKLAIKGRSQDVVVPVTLTQAAGVTTATGSFTIKRLVFAIGENQWSDTSMVADEVQVRLKLALSGVGKL